MSESEPKKETVRITLPPRPTVGEAGSAPVKKETVRINLPSRPSLGTQSAADPKRESTRLSNLAKPPVLNPPRPAAPSAPGLNPALAKPAPMPPGAPAAPRPPMPPAAPKPPGAPIGAAPTAPAAPRPPVAPGTPKPPVAPATTVVPAVRITGAPASPAAPVGTTTAQPGSTPASEAAGLKPTIKKDTVRIEVPSARQVPQATVKLQQTPLIRPSPAEVRTLATTPAVTTSAVDSDVLAEEDPLVKVISIGVFVLALATVIIQALTLFSK